MVWCLAVWGWLFGSTFFQNNGADSLMMAEPLVGWMVGALECAVIGGGSTAVGACLFSLLVPKRGRVICETMLNGEDSQNGC
jgi:hypothetical protein